MFKRAQTEKTIKDAPATVAQNMRNKTKDASLPSSNHSFFTCGSNFVCSKRFNPVISGTTKTQQILKDIKEIAVINFDHNDVIRHPLVTKIVQAYQKSNNNDKG